MDKMIKKTLVFIFLCIFLIGSSRYLFLHVLPDKPARVNSESMKPTYNMNDIVFYRPADSYKVDDVVLYKSTRPEMIIVRIIDKNPDGTFVVKGDDNSASIPYLDQDNLEYDQIVGKVKYSLNPFVFNLLIYWIEIIAALLLVKPVYSRFERKNK